MDYYLLTDLAARLGYELAVSGAETFRVEDSVRRLLLAYGIECEVFAIPNCLVISLETANGKPLSIMKRIGFHGNNLEAVERLNALCRKICAERPEPGTAEQWLRQTKAECRVFSTPMYYLGNFLGPAGFSLLFGGTLRDAFLAGLMGLIVGLVNRYMSKLETNPFFSTIAAAFAMAVPAYLLAGWGIADNIDAVIIGAAMILVPGLLITNSMRDLIYGDTNSGINRIVQVFLPAFAIALGAALYFRILSPFVLRALNAALGAVGRVLRLLLWPGQKFLKILRVFFKKFFASVKKWFTIFDKMKSRRNARIPERSSAKHEIRQVIAAGEAGHSDRGGLRRGNAGVAPQSDRGQKRRGRRAHKQHYGR